MRRASLPSRLDRLGQGRAFVDRERAVRDLAAEHGLDPAEVRAEWEEITDRVRRFGPCTAEQAIARFAEEFGLPEAELWGEYERSTGTVGVPR